MTVGYVRLSRDDDRRNYASIENQKLIISQYANEHHLTIDLWYEDDGVSGYKFDRPGLQQLFHNLDCISTILIKDFSRLGRHNAKVLLILDEFQENGKRLIAIDDHYDSFSPDDDMIGIKTWFNERYVKDTSKKIKKVLEAKQKAGTLLIQVPFGYCIQNNCVEIVNEEASFIQQIYILYLNGYGYRRLAEYLNACAIPTPSMSRQKRELRQGHCSHRKIAFLWSDSMVKNILNNDFYIGTLRLHKRARTTIHGKDKRIPKVNHYVFKDHHPAIITQELFEQVQKLKQSRIKTHFRSTSAPNLFTGFLFCKDCGHRLTPITRKMSNGKRVYYICSTYNSKGKQYCQKSHLIKETDLIEQTIGTLILHQDILKETIVFCEQSIPKNKTLSVQTQINKQICGLKKQLSALLLQKTKDLSSNLDYQEILSESYKQMEEELLEKIHILKKDLNETYTTQNNFKQAAYPLELLNQVIENQVLTREMIELCIEKIIISASGDTEILLKSKEALHNALSNRWYARDDF
jgi:DNA invertase Pin-like site-specific DNA recombinase